MAEVMSRRQLPDIAMRGGYLIAILALYMIGGCCQLDSGCYQLDSGFDSYQIA